MEGNKSADLAYYLCLAVAGFCIAGGLAAKSDFWVSLGVFNLLAAFWVGKISKKQ